MRNRIVLATAVMAAFIITRSTPALPAQHAPHEAHTGLPLSKQAFLTGQVKGKIVEINQTSITVERQQKGRTETVTCLIGDRTKIKGKPEVGADVVVKYREEYGNKTATRIEVKRAG